MSETLFDIANSNLNSAYRLLSTLGDDPRDLNIVGYLIQQASEICLKYVLEESGSDYPRTHDVQELFYLVLNSDTFVPSSNLEATLTLFAGTLTSWEARSRYIKNWFLELKTVCCGFSLVNSLLLEVSTWANCDYTPYDLSQLKKIQDLLRKQKPNSSAIHTLDLKREE